MNAEEIARQIRESDQWNDNLNRQLCEEDGLLEEYEASDADHFEEVVFRAADHLNVEI